MVVSGHHHVPTALTPGKNPGTNSTGLYMDPADGMDVLEKKQICCRCQISNPDCQAGSLFYTFRWRTVSIIEEDIAVLVLG